MRHVFLPLLLTCPSTRLVRFYLRAAPPSSAVLYPHWTRQTPVTGAWDPSSTSPPCLALRLFVSLKSSDESCDNGVAVAGARRSLPESSIRKPPVNIDSELRGGLKRSFTDVTMIPDRVNLRWEPTLQTVWNYWTVALPCRYCVSEASFTFLFFSSCYG